MSDAARTAVAEGANSFSRQAGVGLPSNLPSLPEMSDATRNAVADGAASVSRQAGVVAGTAIVTSQGLPPQGKPIATSIATAAGVASAVADVVEQVVRPNFGQAFTGSLATGVNKYLSKRFPGVASVTNEMIEQWKASDFTKSLQDWLNTQLQSGGVNK